MSIQKILIALGIIIILAGMVAAMMGADMGPPTWLAIIGAFVAMAGIISALPEK